MSSSRQVPPEPENPISVFPSEGDDASSPGAGGLPGETENAFFGFPSEDQPASVPKQLEALSGFQPENRLVPGLPSEDEPACDDESDGGPTEEVGSVGVVPVIWWRPAVASIARTYASSVSASRVFWWPLLIAAVGMLAVETASRRDSTGAKSAAGNQAVANLQGPRVPALLPAVPANPADAAATMVLSATDTKGGGAAIVSRPAEILASTVSVPPTTIARGPVAPTTLAPAESRRSRTNDLAPEAATALSGVAAATPPSVEAHSPESPAVDPVAEEVPVPSARLPIAPVIVDAEASDRAAIDRVLGTYQQSYSSLDAAMVSTIWRGLDTRGLQRAFKGLDSQRMSFEHCDVHVGAETAKAACTGVLDYVRKIGQATPLQKRLSWNFDLQRTGDRWLISGVDAR